MNTRRSRIIEDENVMDEELPGELERQFGERSRVPSLPESVQNGQDE
jgi:hypothetical protein